MRPRTKVADVQLPITSTVTRLSRLVRQDYRIRRILAIYNERVLLTAAHIGSEQDRQVVSAIEHICRYADDNALQILQGFVGSA